MLTPILQTLFQTVCPICGNLDPGAMICRLCFMPMLIREACERCGDPLTHAMPECDRCREGGIQPLVRCRSLLVLTEKDREVLRRIKFQDFPELLRIYRPVFEDKFCFSLPKDVAIVPVPLYWHRFFQRGYNVSRILAEWVSQKTSGKMVDDAIRKIRNTPQQSGLSASARRHNLRASFDGGVKLNSNSRVLLVDDVFTTGSTLLHCANALQRSGIREVYGWTLFRTLKG